MAFTSGNDTNIIQSTDASVVSAGAGNDTYIISDAFIGAGQNVQITDTQGTNTIQLVGGLTIVSSAVTATATQLILSNGATVTLLGANNFTYLVGGDSLTGAGGATENYETFVTNTLGLASAPTDSTPVSGGSVEVGGTSSGGDSNALTTSTDNLVGTSGNDAFSGVLTDVATSTTLNGTDSIIDTLTTDNDTLTLSLEKDLVAGDTGTIRNIETIKANVNATTLTDTNLDFDATDFSGVKTFEIDITKAVSAVSGVNITNIDGDATVVVSEDFSAIEVDNAAATDSLVVDVNATGSSGSPVTVVAGGGTASKDLTVTGAGHLDVTSSNTGFNQVTAEKGLTVSAAAANVLFAEAKDGDLTVSDATAAVVAEFTATGDVTASNLAGASKLTVNAGGSIELNGAVAATSATLSATGTSLSGAAAALTALNISGNGADATFDFSNGTALLKDVTASGDQNVTLQLDIGTAGGGTNKLNIFDALSAGDFTLELNNPDAAAAGSAGDLDLRGGDLIDVLKLGIDNAGSDLSVKSGQNINITADQSATNTIVVGDVAAKGSNSLTLTLDDEKRDTNAVDLDGTTIKQAKTVTINASVDTTSAGSTNEHTIEDLDASDANSDVTVNMGVNTLTLAGANDLGTGTLTITGSGPVNLGASTLTASELDASAVTGAVTGTALNPTNVAIIKTGSAADELTLANTAAADLNLSTAAGNDTVTLAGQTTAEKTTAIDLGEGTDTLKFTAGTKLVAGDTGSVAVSGLEKLSLADGAGQEIQGSVLNGQSFTVISQAAGNTNSVGIMVATDDTVLDLSQLDSTTTTSTTISGMTFEVDASANLNSIAITGFVNADNKITGSEAMDTLTGGNLDDSFAYSDADDLFDLNGVMQDTIDGGTQSSTGADTILITAGGSTTFSVANTDVWSKLSNVESITAADSDEAISLVLDVTAQTAGINTVDLSGDGSATGTNVVDVSEFTSGITIRGASDAAVDNLTGGSGNDTFVYEDATSINNATTAFVDTVNGGAGTDTLLLGTSSAGVTLANTVSFARVSNVETIEAKASTAATSVTLNANAWAAGVRTVDLSAVDSDAATAPNASTIDVSAITGGGMTLTGSTAGATSITGGSGADTITGGAGNDTIVGGAGADIITAGAGDDNVTGGAGSDSIALGTGSDTVVLAASNSGYDTITDFTAGDGAGRDILNGLAAGGTALVNAAAMTSPGTATAAINLGSAGLITEFTSIFTGTGLDSETDGSALLTALKALNANTSGTTFDVELSVTDGSSGFLVAYQNNNAYIYSYADVAGGAGSGDATTSALSADEITLIAKLVGVSNGDLVADNFTV